MPVRASFCRCGKREEGGDDGGVSATGAGAGRGKCGLKHLVWWMLHEGGCDLKHLRVLRVEGVEGLRGVARVVQTVGAVVRHVVRKHVVLPAHSTVRTVLVSVYLSQ